MQACFKGLGDTMAAAIGAALTANQEQMNKALKAAIDQYEERYPDREVKVVKDTQWYVRFVTTLRTTLPKSSPTTAASSSTGAGRPEETKRLTQLEKENARLKKLLAEAELEKAML